MMETGRFAARGYAQSGSMASAISLPIPAGLSAIPPDADGVLIVPQAQNIRWRDDGTDPTTSVGQLLTAGSQLWYRGTLANFRAIEVTASAILNVSYYKSV